MNRLLITALALQVLLVPAAHAQDEEEDVQDILDEDLDEDVDDADVEPVDEPDGGYAPGPALKGSPPPQKKGWGWNLGDKVDWDAFVQCKDRLLKKFAETGEVNGANAGFYVMLKRSHYFKDDVPDVEGKLCFYVESPMPGERGVYAFVDKLSAEARELESKIRWGALYFPVVRLSRVEQPDGEPYLVLREVVRDQWRSN